MKKFFAALLGLVLLAAPAAATNYNVYNDDDLTTANGAAAPGDTIFLASNTYNVFPVPVANGEWGNHIVYIGKRFARDSVVIDALPTTWNGYVSFNPDDRFERKCVTLMSMKFNQAWEFDTGGNNPASEYGNDTTYFKSYEYNRPNDCALINVIAPSITLHAGAQNMYLDSVYVTAAGTFRIEPGSQSPCNITIKNSSFVISASGGTKAMRIAPNTHSPGSYYIADDPVLGLVFEKSRFLITVDSTVTANAGCWDTHNMRSATFTDCYFELTNLSPATDTGTGGTKTRFLLNLRDGCRYNIFTRDTFYVKAGYPGTTVLSNPGQEQMAASFNKFTGCVFKNFSYEAGGASANERAAIYLWPMNSDTLSRCLFVAGPGNSAFSAGEGSLTCPDCPAHTHAEIDHCTFYGDPVTAAQSIVFLGGEKWGDDLKTLVFKNNIIYSGEYVVASSSGDVAVSYWYSTGGAQQTLDKLTPNHAGWYGDSAKVVLVGIIGSPGAVFDSLPAGWASGHPGFADTTAAAFNYALTDTTLALALTTDEFGGASGAWIATDTTRPYVINDLHRASINGFKIRLAWTATGDDSLTGTPTYYECRYATTDITNNTQWNAATYGGQLRPATYAYGAGTEDIIVDLTGKAAGDYYFAVRAYDDAGNPSAVSNRVLQHMGATGGGGAGPGKLPD